ncbi:hypothetical protein GCM10010317_097030 [Streptomyces mirabilis]|nr:hypothetical protein GCM10010317_097030 [Streptomyces mirabilis]
MLQTLHGLSGFEAVQHLRCDLRWKAACGLGPHDRPFDPSLLAYFRRRLARSRRPVRLFDAVREVVEATGALKGRHRRALDSAVLDDAVATQDTVTQLVAAIRRVIREVPGAERVAAEHCRAHDYADPGKPKISWNDEQARNTLVAALVTDALLLLGHLPQQDLGPKAAEAAGILALVAGQDVEPADDSDGTDGRWRLARHTAPDRMVSTVAPQARHVHKARSHRQDGFKAHLAVEPETGLITAITLRPAAGAEHHEAAVAADLLQEETGALDILADSTQLGAVRGLHKSQYSSRRPAGAERRRGQVRLATGPGSRITGHAPASPAVASKRHRPDQLPVSPGQPARACADPGHPLRPSQVRTTGLPVSAMPARRSSVTAASVLSAATPAV